MHTKDLLKLGKNLSLDLFYHGYENYMQHAFPDDELNPLSCQGNNEMFGGVSLTLIDTIDMLGIIGNSTAFTEALWTIVDNVDFDKDKVVSVFEMNIRVLGGLLSAHIMARDDKLNLMLKKYKVVNKKNNNNNNNTIIIRRDYHDELLNMAEDLGKRLLVAFDTPTGIPYGSVNLRHGVAKNETPITCTAGGGSFLIEFGVLSRLTHNGTYERAARRASHALWGHRSALNLVGAHINILTGVWSQNDAGIGTFIDSFYEYMLKSYIMFGKKEDLLMFIEGYTAVVRYLKRGPWYIEANMESGNVSHAHFTSLQGFWPGLQVLFGDVDMASDTIRAFLSLTDAYTFPPERFNIKTISIEDPFYSYPLRPEFIESMYYLHKATHSKEWLNYGLDILLSMHNISKTECGVASVANVSSLFYDDSDMVKLEDKMPSYFLAETCKYFYLLFDDDNDYVNKHNIVFSTEGHPFPIGKYLNRFSRKQHKETINDKNNNNNGMTNWEYYSKSNMFKTTQTNAVESLLSFAEQPCKKPSILDYNPLLDRLYDPLEYEEFKCWPEEGKYVSNSSPPFSYEVGYSPFEIRQTLSQNNNNIGMHINTNIFEKETLTNMFFYAFLILRVVMIFWVHFPR